MHSKTIKKLIMSFEPTVSLKHIN